MHWQASRTKMPQCVLLCKFDVIFLSVGVLVCIEIFKDRVGDLGLT